MRGLAIPTQSRLCELIAGLQGQPVGVVADLVVDRFISGVPKRISREAPVLILRYEGEHITPGGGANAIANVAALGGRPTAVGVVGPDAEGALLVADLDRRGIVTSGIVRHPSYRTPTKNRLLAGATFSVRQQVVRWDVEDTLALSDPEIAALVAPLAAAGNLPVVVLSDYGYGSVTPAVARAARDAAGPRAQLVCDSRYRLGEFTGLDAATPNQEEAEALLGSPLPGGATLDAVGLSLRERLRLRVLLITRGSRGMSLFVDRGILADAPVAAHIPVHGTDQVADVTGAGDTVIGTFALALAAGASPLEAALLADYAGGIVVQKMGTATCDARELTAAVQADPKPLEELRWASY
jgi:rfaE bifunctional protein kinase chain/domain